jgi:hypothetical protein
VLGLVTAVPNLQATCLELQGSQVLSVPRAAVEQADDFKVKSMSSLWFYVRLCGFTPLTSCCRVSWLSFV